MKKNKTKSALRTVIIVCIAVFLVVNIYLLNVQTLQGNALPMPFGVGAAIVLSGSMEPELSVDDLIIVVSREDYAVGDVVVYQSGSALVVHRIIEITDGLVTTQGDANNTPDQPIKLSDIKGEVAWKISYVGVVLNFIKSPLGVVIILAAAFLLMELSYRKEKRDSYSELDDIKAEIRRLQSEFAAEQSPQPKEEIKQEPENKDS